MSTLEDFAALAAPKPKIYTVVEIAKALATNDDSEILKAIADGFVAYSQGKVSVPPIQTMGQLPLHPFVDPSEGSQMCIKSGYIEGDEHLVVKMAPGSFLSNREIGLPVNTGLNLIFSQKTGRTQAILLDEGLLTEIRTAACGALAASLLAPSQLTAIGVIGSGMQARWQLRMLKGVTECRKVFLFALERLEDFEAEMGAEGWEVHICSSAEEVVAEVELLLTVTTTRTPIIKASWLKARGLGAEGGGQAGRPLHINCIGADAEGKGELEPECVAMAQLLCTDSLVQTVVRGEFQHAISAGLVSAESVSEIGELLDRDRKGGFVNPHSDADNATLTIFDTSGVSVEDIMITKCVYQALVAMDADAARARL
jgi:ornithine cyclodeaminase